ncbi:hypothetical protein VSS74_10210 [Conexibacter stalactiti]|uniref:Uncharacterized protein n=1 Tax=Conexibacter stalactiti TaxID=1940611 RepID=A0ABU4HN22_9ACTN|nr:hypothetical protein [Conexibacter stalactiti]MDW5594711.1 hypothetical protein [Conexibacter stalactiti]MEC5035353.1 hypothetical protein [Conexibacter stalactiti]
MHSFARRAGLPLLALGAAALPAAAPAFATAATTAPAASTAATTAPYELSVELARADARMRELRLTARCPSGCTLRLRTLSLSPYKTRGGVEQLQSPLPQTLSGGRRAAPGKTVVLRVPVSPSLSGAASGALQAGQAVVAGVVVEVGTADGNTYTVAPQAVVRTASTPAPFPETRTTRSTVVRLPKVKPGDLIPYWVTIRGTQRSSWRYDRGEQRGSCTVIANGSGTQQLKFRTVRPFSIVQGQWEVGRTDDPSISAGKEHGYGGAYIPVKVDAVRDSGANTGVSGDCDGTSGGEGRPAPACERSGSKIFHFHPFMVDRGTLYVSTTFGGADDDVPGQKPDCPVEHSDQVAHPLQVLPLEHEGDGHPNSDLTKGMKPGSGDAPGLVIERFKKTRSERIDGGTLTTTTRFELTFRRKR